MGIRPYRVIVHRKGYPTTPAVRLEDGWNEVVEGRVWLHSQGGKVERTGSAYFGQIRALEPNGTLRKFETVLHTRPIDPMVEIAEKIALWAPEVERFLDPIGWSLLK